MTGSTIEPTQAQIPIPLDLREQDEAMYRRGYLAALTAAAQVADNWARIHKENGLATHVLTGCAATIERCAQVAANWEHDHYGTGKGIAAAIRALKMGKDHA